MSLCPSGPGVDVNDILRVLQRPLSPTLKSRQFEIRARHRDLRKTPKNQDIEKYELVEDFKDRYREMGPVRNNLITVNNAIAVKDLNASGTVSTNTDAKPPTFK
ncbi:hypothetical protein AJ78_03251 [Emergomyces pasteurianus Ep9510]|uniref:Uncharacterized protein n=1 Tax=Emergomyces pasteurianus Ep9510 TaxID=1447872 RepID=A0A1J9Q8R1_9EURO|nr:hypothetical protein AJ78_03251 [Emergomyces pasteurianus Ep9510]